MHLQNGLDRAAAGRRRRASHRRPPPLERIFDGGGAGRWGSYYAFYAQWLRADDVLIKCDDDVVHLSGLEHLVSHSSYTALTAQSRRRQRSQTQLGAVPRERWCDVLTLIQPRHRQWQACQIGR